MRKFFLFFTASLLICSVLFSSRGEEIIWFVDENPATVSEPDPRAQARMLMRNMSDDEKIGQLLMVSPEDLTGEKRTERMADGTAFEKYPVGGVILYGQNITSAEQLRALTDDIFSGCKQQDLYTPFVAIDEEGGYVSRIANKLGFEKTLSAPVIGETKDTQYALKAGQEIGAYLRTFGINLDLAPVADVLVAKAPEVAERAYGTDPYLVSDMAWQMACGLKENGIVPCYKHFPGHGSVQRNAHNTPVSHVRTLDEMENTELIPFRFAIEQDIEMIMLSHLAAKAVDSEWPASMSRKIVTDLLRNKMGYEGVVITDAYRMDAIREKYTLSVFVTMAINAGADILLVPGNGQEAFKIIKTQVTNGSITWERIEESVERIIALKIKSGLIQ